MAAGIVYVTNDRRSEALALPLSVRENLELPLLGALSRFGVMQPQREQAVSDELIVRLAIRPPHPEQAVVLLSGGNQQKVSLSRWLNTRPHVFLFDEPTQGVAVRWPGSSWPPRSGPVIRSPVRHLRWDQSPLWSSVAHASLVAVAP
jgi:ABC-type sugar transport system ATPase subunit